ncbi:MAG: endo-1,4-beta-xylanase [Eubacterium sp.]|nr:endo-1,4-beta-xylanase [Eubacterium sp.]
MKRLKQVAANLLIASLTIAPLSANVHYADAAGKPSLSVRKLTLSSGKTKTLTLKNAKKMSTSWKTNKKKVVAITKKTRTTCKVKALAQGKATITCKVKNGKKVTSLTCKITVPAKKPTPVKTADVTTTPVPTQTPSDAPLETPSVTTTPTQHPLANESILENYKDYFGYVGTCLTYGTDTSPNQLQKADIMEHVKKHYNSFTLENEMKPDAILGSSANTISVSEAKKLGYIIPENYKEESVPQLNLDRLDKVLKVAYDNGLRMRAHTLVWHSQTPAWFFSKNYNTNIETDPDTMDARLEFYIRTVMSHVMDKELEITGKSGSIIYAWDVVNEYLHRYAFNWALNWTSVYGDMGDSPSYVKKAFEIAYDVLKTYQATDDVVLFYNDYNTYFDPEGTINLVNFINENEPANICGGIGMQSHVDIKVPTVEEYGDALEQFLNTGLEVQITELDMTINFNTDGDNPSYNYKKEGETNEDQAAFVSEFMNMIISKQLNRDKSVSPKGITSLTLWGLYDKISWRKRCAPLLFGKNINDPKPSFYTFIEAAKKNKQ